MEREIKFRGKNLRGKWIYGDLLRNRGETFIAPDGIANPLATFEDFQVDPETVGQYTGLKDKNGQEIYEGDVMKVPTNPYIISDARGIVHYEDAQWFGAGDFLFAAIDSEAIVIGNIHDNPELLNP